MLDGRVAVITGATRGIGREIVNRFAAAGAAVVGIYQSSTGSAEELAAHWQERGRTVRFFQGSVADSSFVAEVFRQVWSEFGRLDVLVNNAGITRDNLLMQMTDEQWQGPIHVNWEGTFNCCAEAIPYMRRQSAGAIINMVSVTAVLGREAQCNYGASKGAIIGLTRTLSRLYGAEGIRVNALAPGMIETEMIDHVPAKKLENFTHHTHPKRLGRASEVADAALFLATNLSSYFTGTVLKLDGGFVR